MLHNVSVIGLGACGNKNAILANKKEFTTISVNSTHIDMNIDETKDLANHNNVLIGKDGCGMLRENGKKLVKETHQKYTDSLIAIVKDSKIIITNAALGGGTGSGSLPITSDLLRSELKQIGNDKKIIIPVGILPTNAEDIRKLRNAIEACNEIESLNMPYMLIDNGRYTGSVKDMFETINRSLVEDFTVIRGDYNAPSQYGNMDGKDCERLFSTPGLLTINKISGFKETTFDKESFDSLILKSIGDSYNVQIEKDHVIKRMGLIINVTEAMYNKFDTSLSKVKAELGTPAEIFTQVNVIDDPGKCCIITILAGLSFPDTRLEEMAEIIESKKEALTKKSTSKIGDFNKSLDWLDSDDEEDEDESTEDILSKW